MPSPPSLASLVVQQTLAQIYAGALSLAQAFGLPVTSWLPGDPTRSLLWFESNAIETLESIVVGYISSGFLDYAAQPLADGSVNPWLSIVAQQVFNVTVPGATYATTSVTLTNAGGGVYIVGPGDLTFKNSTGATYHNTTSLTLTGVGSPGATGLLSITADQPGSASSASASEITLVTVLQGVTATNPAAAIGTDAQAPATTVAQCRAKQASTSPNGPAAAYPYVALTPALTGVQTITRARVYPNSATGNVQVYVASASGTVGFSDVAAVQNAITTWAMPLCITPVVSSANPVIVPVTYALWVYQSVNQTSAQIQAAVLTALQTLFASRQIGGDIIPPATTGLLYQSEILATIGSVFPNQTFRVTVASPTGDTALGNGDVPLLGTVTATINIIAGG